MDLRRRLARFTAADSASAPPALVGVIESSGAGSDVNTSTRRSTDAHMNAGSHAARVAELRALVTDVITRGRPAQRAHEIRATSTVPAPPPAGARHDTPHGPLHVIERGLEPNHAHGRVALREALAVTADTIALLALDRSCAGVDPSRMLILDTETTGLRGGTGTVAFLVGLAWFEGGCLRLEQLFLRDFDEEAPLLHRVAERVARASLLVTYNGKSFDWPLLRTRFILHRIATPRLPPHVDLLHCARRLVRERLEGMRLAEVERGLLGHHREDDVDGSEIPGIYLRYLRGAGPEAITRVLAHNAHDLVALPAVLGALGARVSGVRRDGDPAEHLACARLAVRAGAGESACLFARAAIDGGAEGYTLHHAHALIAGVQQRAGHVDAAAGAWRAALATAADPATASVAHLALAKLHEHTLRELSDAAVHARGTELAEGVEAHRRRVARLDRKIAHRASAGPARDRLRLHSTR